METHAPFVVGMVGGALTTISFLPQVIKVVRTRSVGDLSLPMFVIHAAGDCMWIAYGVMTRDAVITSYEVVASVLNLVIVAHFFPWWWRHEEEKEKNVLEEI